LTIRLATDADIARIYQIRFSVSENLLSDPSLVTAEHVGWFIEQEALWVWHEADGLVTGFSGCDVRDGTVWALFVAPGHEGKGIGRALLNQACDALREAGHAAATLTTGAGTRAERHYRADGWSVIGTTANGDLVFQKEL